MCWWWFSMKSLAAYETFIIVSRQRALFSLWFYMQHTLLCPIVRLWCVYVCVCVCGGGGGGGELDLRVFFPKFAIWPPPPPTITHKRVVVSCTILPCNCCDYRVISPLRNAEFKKRYICSCNEIIYIRKGFVLLFFHSFVKTIKIFRITPSRVTCV